MTFEVICLSIGLLAVVVYVTIGFTLLHKSALVRAEILSVMIDLMRDEAEKSTKYIGDHEKRIQKIEKVLKSTVSCPLPEGYVRSEVES